MASTIAYIEAQAALSSHLRVAYARGVILVDDKQDAWGLPKPKSDLDIVDL